MKGKARSRRIWIAIVSFLPLLFGFYAYLNIVAANNADGHYDVLSALYSAMKLYFAGGEVSAATFQNLRAFRDGAVYLPTRIFLEAGRWLGLFVTASFVARLFYQTLRALRIRVKARSGSAIALHGQENYVRLLSESIGRNAIVTDEDDKFAAGRHILAFGCDLELYQYLNEHFSQLSKPRRRTGERQVFLCAVTAPRTDYQSSGFMISNMAENCARIYWRELYLRHLGDRPETRVAIIGFGAYGQELLKQALLVNVFIRHAPPLRYDVFGDSTLFMSSCGGIVNFASINGESPEKDGVWFHPDGFERNAELLKKTDRIIIACDSEESSLQALRQLLAMDIHKPIHVRASSAELVQCLWPKRKVSETLDGAEICVFGTDRSLYNQAIIMDEKLLYAAQCIHARYMKRAGADACARCKRAASPDTCVKDCAEFREAWKKLGSFYQNSNIAQADHIPVKVREILGRNCFVSGESAAECARRYAELDRGGLLTPYFKLEHDRWMRNQYLYGWVYNPVRDNAQKKHNLMLPFDSLPEAQKNKDRDAYQTMFDLLSDNAAQ